MKRPDWFLIGIVVAVILLVVVALAYAMRQPEPEFREDGTPSGVAHDYLLALAESDYERAWGYVSPSVAGYPGTLEQFVDDVADQGWTFGLSNPSRAIEVPPADIAGDRAVATVVESTFRQAGLFDSAQSTQRFAMTLAREGDTWRIVDGERYWHRCWRVEPPCDWRDDPLEPPEPADTDAEGAAGESDASAEARVGADDEPDVSAEARVEIAGLPDVSAETREAGRDSRDGRATGQGA
jgi:hypothetical protein